MRRFVFAITLLAGAFAVAAPARPAAPPAPAEPKFVNDDELYEQFFEKVQALAKQKKTLAHKQLVAKMNPRAAGVVPAKPGSKALAPEEVYAAAVNSVWIVGSAYLDKEGEWQRGTYATAWVAAADGVLVTNWHVFEDLQDGEVFAASDRDGNIYPVTDFIGGDKTADVAVFRVGAKGLTPLPIAPAYAEIGSWVGVVSHPADLFYMFTQGAVTRYSTNKNEDDRVEKWMGITAEYASGSSGAPVLNKYGTVVGMAALTLSLDAHDDAAKGQNPARRAKPVANPKRLSRADQPKDDKGDKPKPPEKPEEKPKGSSQQMVVKLAVPGPTVLKWVGK
ncbi:MAG: trypsin-like peptidase domain-containing protein [Planctomycetes bacterium]|nr:trypsin-like peptidase domain-containing protein [Planctomycetota bacterium]